MNFYTVQQFCEFAGIGQQCLDSLATQAFGMRSTCNMRRADLARLFEQLDQSTNPS